MRLRNKKTGEIIDNVRLYTGSGREIHSISEITDEWEDYKVSKEYWYIDPDNSIVQNHKPTYINHLLDGLKSIGNYFETKEEAEKAVEKLKAWKRLKDKGFRFDRWKNDKEKYLGDFVIWAHTKDLTDIVDDLDLLFSGEDD